MLCFIGTRTFLFSSNRRPFSLAWHIKKKKIYTVDTSVTQRVRRMLMHLNSVPTRAQAHAQRLKSYSTFTLLEKPLCPGLPLRLRLSLSLCISFFVFRVHIISTLKFQCTTYLFISIVLSNGRDSFETINILFYISMYFNMQKISSWIILWSDVIRLWSCRNRLNLVLDETILAIRQLAL